MRSFLQGVVAGYGIAIPVGPVSVLIMQTSTRRGLGIAAAAGMGAASADLVYATLSVAFGSAAAELLEPVGDELRLVAAAILIVVAVRGLLTARHKPDAEDAAGPGAAKTFAGFLGITMLNPVTIAYFAALVLGLRLAAGSLGGKFLFVLGAFLASASWQLAVATFGTVLHHALGERGRVATSVAGSLIIAGLAVYMLVS